MAADLNGNKKSSNDGFERQKDFEPWLQVRFFTSVSIYFKIYYLQKNNSLSKG
jgi:hypothetical protein